MSDDFQHVLNHIRSVSGAEVENGRLFERLMKAYFTQDSLYRDRFSGVWFRSEWAKKQPHFCRPSDGQLSNCGG